MDIETARGVAGRVWCDEEMSHVVMDADLAEAIAKIVQVAAKPRPEGVSEIIEIDKDGNVMPAGAKVLRDPGRE